MRQLEITSIDFIFAPASMRTKDDPRGERGFFSWKVRIGGKQYGKVNTLPGVEFTPELRKSLMVEAIADIEAVAAELALQAPAAA